MDEVILLRLIQSKSRNATEKLINLYTPDLYRSVKAEYGWLFANEDCIEGLISLVYMTFLSDPSKCDLTKMDISTYLRLLMHQKVAQILQMYFKKGEPQGLQKPARPSLDLPSEYINEYYTEFTLIMDELINLFIK